MHCGKTLTNEGVTQVGKGRDKRRKCKERKLRAVTTNQRRGPMHEKLFPNHKFTDVRASVLIDGEKQDLDITGISYQEIFQNG